VKSPALPFLLVLLAAVAAPAASDARGNLDPHAPPGKNFDLAHWKLTLPINRAEERSAAELVAGFQHPEAFFTDPATGGLTFRARNHGDTTSGSHFPRSELREMLAPIGSAKAAANNWVISTSPDAAKRAAGGVDGTMRATLTVDHVSTTGGAAKVGRVVVGQIHGPSTEVIRLYYHKRPADARGAIYFAHDDPKSGESVFVPILGDPKHLNPPDGIALGEPWSYEIQVVGRTLTVKVTPHGRPTTTVTHPIHAGYDGLALYFKVGVYNQNNTGEPGDYVQATFHALTHSHP
jgi:hypothetical protein